MIAPENFCKFLKNGLVYNNNTTNFTVSPCCYFYKNYSIDTLQDVSKQIRDYQKLWLAEDFNKACRTCLDIEKSGTNSYRQSSFDQITTDHDHFGFLTVAVNKKCNLACPSCNSGSSSFWYQENVRNGIPESDIIVKLHQEDREHIITEKFLSVFKNQDLSEITYIKFGGGEPLMSDTHEQILNLIPSPENVTVQYTSNFSIMPSKNTLGLWKKFKLIKWVASIDGVGEQFTLLRWPYKYQALDKFVDTAKISVPSNVMFGVEHTINVLNAFYYDKFESWFNSRLGSNREGDASDLALHPCSGVLSLSNMPLPLRNLVKNKLGPAHPVSVMIDQHPFLHDTSSLIDYLDNLDKIRNQNWREIFPEIQHYLT